MLPPNFPGTGMDVPASSALRSPPPALEGGSGADAKRELTDTAESSAIVEG